MPARRISRFTALALAVAAAAPATSLAMPLKDNMGDGSPPPEPVTIVREVPADGPDPVLALAVSGAALLVAVGAGGLTLRRGSRAAEQT